MTSRYFHSFYGIYEYKTSDNVDRLFSRTHKHTHPWLTNASWWTVSIERTRRKWTGRKKRRNIYKTNHLKRCRISNYARGNMCARLKYVCVCVRLYVTFHALTHSHSCFHSIAHQANNESIVSQILPLSLFYTASIVRSQELKIYIFPIVFFFLHFLNFHLVRLYSRCFVWLLDDFLCAILPCVFISMGIWRWENSSFFFLPICIVKCVTFSLTFYTLRSWNVPSKCELCVTFCSFLISIRFYSNIGIYEPTQRLFRI